MSKYLSKFLSILNPFKDALGFFQTQNSLVAAANEASDALKNGDFERFLKNYNPTNPYSSFNDYGTQIAINGSYELFLKVEKVGIENNAISKHFYNNLFNWSLARDHVQIVKHLIDHGHSSVANIDDGSFKTIIEQNAEKLLFYTLYDLNYKPSNAIMHWLTVENPNEEVVAMIQKRDLFMNLDGMKTNDAPKKSRPKI